MIFLLKISQKQKGWGKKKKKPDSKYGKDNTDIKNLQSQKKTHFRNQISYYKKKKNPTL